ncbi:MAG: hypothetical protein KF729_36630 [Sandaracinaceae bacterium]|nr:hypothetical protein [Sandaracinaceae bacterium]
MGASPRGRLVRLVEAAYQLRPDVATWIDELTSNAAELVPEAEGTVSRLLELSPRRLRGYTIRLRDPELARIMREQEGADALSVDVVMHGPDLGLRRLRGDAPSADASAPVLSEMVRRFEGTGIADMHHLTALDAGHCFSLGFLVRDGVDVRGSARAWSRAAVHFAAAFRLQRAAASAFADLPVDGAVLHPDGRVADADGAAQGARELELLRERVRRVDAARARAHREGSARALEVWRGLIDGTWSMIDRHDHDGRRYVVAVPNPVSVPDPRGLSPRLAQVAALAGAGYSDKWIAYALGLERTTVATHLAAALDKLALPSRVALAKAFEPSGAQDP